MLCVGKIDSYEPASLQVSGCQSSADGEQELWFVWRADLSRPKYQGKQRAFLGLGPLSGNKQGGPGEGKEKLRGSMAQDSGDTKTKIFKVSGSERREIQLVMSTCNRLGR